MQALPSIVPEWLACDAKIELKNSNQCGYYGGLLALTWDKLDAMQSI